MSKPLAIANYRVSSDEQLKNNSLSKQKKVCLAFISSLGAELHKSWEGSVSSKKGNNLNRKDLQEMLDECRRNGRIKYVVFDELDRFMRSMLEIGHFIIEFQRLNVEVKFASQPNLGTETATDTLLLMLEAYKAEGSNEERQRKSINGQVNALKEGRYTFHPKPGYVKGEVAGIHRVDPVKGPALQRVLKDLAMNRVTPTQALINLNNSEFMHDGHSLYKMDKFRKIATDPYYAGILEVDKQVKVRNENGLHESLITKGEHSKLIEIMNAKKKVHKGPRKNGNPEYPLSNLVKCDICIDKEQYPRFVGLGLKNGKSDKVYHKYRCRGCIRHTTREEMHTMIEECFASNPITERGYNELLKALEIVWKREASEAKEQANHIRAKIKSFEQIIARKVDALTDPKNELVHDEILAQVERTKVESNKCKVELDRLERSAKDDKAEFMEFAYDFIENTGKHFLDTDLISRENRERCKQLVFPGGFNLNEDGNVYTPEISLLYRLARAEKGTEVPSNSHLVRAAGFKPAASSLATMRSIS